MWIEKKKNEEGEIIAYKYVERYDNPFNGKSPKVSVTLQDDKKKTQKLAQEILNKKINEALQKKDYSITFSNIIDDWFNVYKHTVKMSTVSRATTNIVAIKDAIGSIKFERLTAAHINSFYLEGLQSKRFKYNSIKQIDSIIKRVIKFGYKFKNINKMNLIPLLDIPNINKSEKNQYKYLEKNELKKVIEYFEENNLHELKRLAILQSSTGMRFGEMISLTFQNIDFSNNTINIERTYDYDNKVFSTPKTGDMRIIYFNDSISRLLKEQINFAKEKIILKSFSRDNTLLFTTTKGNPFRIQRMNNNLAKIDIPGKKVTTHYFRHTFVSLAVESGISRDLIAEQVGHTDTKMIDEVYAHFTLNMQKQQKEAMLNFRII